jgi:hypothetical protein
MAPTRTHKRILLVAPIVCLIGTFFFVFGPSTPTFDTLFLDHLLATPITGLDSLSVREVSANISSSEAKGIGRDSRNSTTTTHSIPDSVEISRNEDFQHRHPPIPPSYWAVMDNTTCVTHPLEYDPHGEDEEGESSWRQRIPYVLILGTQKGGTTALAQYLYKHPQVFHGGSSKEMHFFSDKWDLALLGHFATTPLTTDTGGIHREHALLRYTQLIQEELFQKRKNGFLTTMNQVKSDDSIHILDATPNYMFASDRVPARIMCVCKWVKLIVVLRDPVDRAFSQWVRKKLVP